MRRERRLPVAPIPTGATSATVGGATERARSPEPKTADSSFSRATSPCGGATEADPRPRDPAEDAEAERAQAKLELLDGGES